jgi:hypothetical protein
MRRVLASTLALALAVIGPRTVAAQQTPAQAALLPHPAALPPRQANYAWDADLLRASFSYRDVLADPELVKKLSSGLPTVIVMRAYVYREGQDVPVALAARVCRVVYDLWDEVYRVHLSEPERERDQAAVLDGVLRLCTEARDLPVVRGAATVLSRGRGRREPRVPRNRGPDAQVDVAALGQHRNRSQ